MFGPCSRRDLRAGYRPHHHRRPTEHGESATQKTGCCYQPSAAVPSPCHGPRSADRTSRTRWRSRRGGGGEAPRVRWRWFHPRTRALGRGKEGGGRGTRRRRRACRADWTRTWTSLAEHSGTESSASELEAWLGGGGSLAQPSVPTKKPSLNVLFFLFLFSQTFSWWGERESSKERSEEEDLASKERLSEGEESRSFGGRAEGGRHV